MAKRPAQKASEQAKRTLKALRHCIQSLAAPDGSVKSPHPRPSDPSSRLFDWLNELSHQERIGRCDKQRDGDEAPLEQLAYAALLQMYLYAHGVSWPEGVFSQRNDPCSTGRGRGGMEQLHVLRVVFKNWETVLKMRADGRSWQSIAKAIGLVEEIKTRRRLPPLSEAKRVRIAGDCLRKSLTPLSVGVLDGEVLHLGCKLLGLTPPEGDGYLFTLGHKKVLMTRDKVNDLISRLSTGTLPR